MKILILCTKTINQTFLYMFNLHIIWDCAKMITMEKTYSFGT